MDNKNGQIISFGYMIVFSCIFLLMTPICGLARQDTEQINVLIFLSQSFQVPENLTVRARLTDIAPEEPTPIQ